MTYKAFVLIAKVCGKRRVSKGVHSIHSGCSRWVFTFVLFIVVRMRVNTRSSLYTKMKNISVNCIHYCDISLH